MTKRGAGARSQLALRREVERLSREGRYEAAVEILEAMVIARPENPLIWNDLGVALEAMGEAVRALEAFRRGVPLFDPPYPPLLFHLARLQLGGFMRETDVASRKTEPAQVALAEIVRLLNASLDGDAENVEAHRLLAMVYGLMGREDLSQLHFAVTQRMRNLQETSPVKVR